MSTHDLAGILEIARRAAGRAAALLKDAQENVGPVHSKSNPRDLVTEWDERAEEVIREILVKGTPGVAIYGEEQGVSNQGSGDARWLVDPIDGTVNFAHGIPFFAVSIGFEVAGQPLVGVVNAPVLGWELSAKKNGGAFKNGKQIAVSRIDTLEQSALATGFPYDRAVTGHNFRQWDHMQRMAGACRRFGAASLDLAMVALGWLDGYWESRLSPWDVSAGAILVAEAGGQLSNWLGGEFSSQTGEVVATNGRIHDELVRELGRA